MAAAVATAQTTKTPSNHVRDEDGADDNASPKTATATVTSQAR